MENTQDDKAADGKFRDGVVPPEVMAAFDAHKREVHSASIVPGAVVRLKSSGPRMTVCEVSDVDCVCAWFSPDGGTLHRERFSLVALDSIAR